MCMLLLYVYVVVMCVYACMSGNFYNIDNYKYNKYYLCIIIIAIQFFLVYNLYFFFY